MYLLDESDSTICFTFSNWPASERELPPNLAVTIVSMIITP